MEFIILYTSMLFCFVNTHQYVNHNLQNEQCYQRQDERILSRRHLGTEKGNPSYSSNLKLAAFNVQTFGRRKMNSPGVPTILVKIILRYDVILIQEIRDSSGKAIVDLLSLVNKASSRGQYDLEISPRLGRTFSKEQYAFLYRRDVLSVKKSYVYDDGQESEKNDTFEREPFIVHFKSTMTNVTDFVLVAIHTSPSKAPQEINELANVYDDVIKRLSITDVIILGDLNAACSYMSDNDWRTNRLANDKRFHWLISDCVDTSLAGGHCAYDRFVAAGDAIVESIVESSAGSFEYDQVLGVKETMASKVSDHYPIEMQLLSKSMASSLKNINKAVEYTFKMKNPPSLNKKTVYGMRKTLKQRKFAVKTTYSSTRSISGVTFSKTFNNKTEALNLLYEIKDKTQPVNMVSFDQIQMAEFQIKGPWGEDRKLSANSFGAVKLVCEILPSVSCWVALTI